MIGLKYVIPTTFPNQPPIPYLDEPLNKMVIEFIDYVQENNILDFAYLHDWKIY